MLRLRRFGQGCSRGSVWVAGDLLAEEVASDGADGQNLSVLVALLWYVNSHDCTTYQRVPAMADCSSLFAPLCALQNAPALPCLSANARRCSGIVDP